VVGSVAGCDSAAGVATREFMLDGSPLGIEELSWGLALSPGARKPKGPRRIEVPGRLNKGDIVILELDMDEGWMTCHVDGVLRAFFQDDTLRSCKQRVEYMLLWCGGCGVGGGRSCVA